jgi:hypothetical protein
MSSATKINPEIIAEDFRSAMQGKLPEDKISSNVEALLAPQTAYPENGSIVSFIVYLQFQVNITNGKSFNGKAGGLATPGGGALFGNVYTDDINRLYANTVSFAFTATQVYLAIYFFDGNSNQLGTFQSGAVSTVFGPGGGTGSWS